MNYEPKESGLNQAWPLPPWRCISAASIPVVHDLVAYCSGTRYLTKMVVWWLAPRFWRCRDSVIFLTHDPRMIANCPVLSQVRNLWSMMMMMISWFSPYPSVYYVYILSARSQVGAGHFECVSPKWPDCFAQCRTKHKDCWQIMHCCPSCPWKRLSRLHHVNLAIWRQNIERFWRNSEQGCPRLILLFHGQKRKIGRQHSEGQDDGRDSFYRNAPVMRPYL